jgi:Domain of unknown function (DUF1990)
MPRRPSPMRRLTTATRWPVGVALTSWSYMWRTTPMHRTEEPGALPDDGPPELPDDTERNELQGAADGAGPLYHRIYRTRIRDAELGPEELVSRVTRDLNSVAPTEMASFQKVLGDKEHLRVGDEITVRMPGPWDGPVRVIEVEPTHFRLATLEGHLEAGQIRFAAGLQDDFVTFTIESWARSGDRYSNLLYHRLRMAKEIQLHMWTSFLEAVVKVSGGRRTGGIEIRTRRVEDLGALA